MEPTLYIGEHLGRIVGIPYADLRHSLYVVGKSGMGKSTLLHNLAVQLILAGEGLCFIDPVGETAHQLIDHVPVSRANDFVYIDLADLAHPVSLNVLENVPADERPTVADNIIAALRALWPSAWGDRMEDLLMATIRALLDYERATLLWVPRMLTNKGCRDHVIQRIQDPEVKRFWSEEWPTFDTSWRTMAVNPVLNKVRRFTDAPVTRNILGQLRSTIHPGRLMDLKKIVLVNLGKGRVGSKRARLVGSLITTRFYQDAMARQGRDLDSVTQFTMILDEFQNTVSEKFAEDIPEVRKYGLGSVFAHQHIGQIKRELPTVFDAATGNVGSLLSFRVGASDAEELAPEFAPVPAEELRDLGRGYAFGKLLAAGEVQNPNGLTMFPRINNFCGGRRKLLRYARERFTRPRATVEGKIDRWMRA